MKKINLVKIKDILIKNLKNRNQFALIGLRFVKTTNRIKDALIENTKKLNKFGIIGILSICILVIFILLKDPLEKKDIELEKTEIEISDSLIEEAPYEIDELESSEKTEVKTDTKKIAKKKVKKKTPPLEPLKKKLETKKSVKEPKDIVQDLHNGLITIRPNQTGSLDRIMTLIQNTYRVEKMLSLIIGNEWKNVSIKKKKQLVNVFTEYISKNYIRRFVKINKPVFTTNEIKDVGKNYKMVRTQLIVGNEKVSVNYLLNEVNGYWKIFDVLLAGSVSEIATKKSEFASFISKNNVDSLIEAISKKNKILLSE